MANNEGQILKRAVNLSDLPVKEIIAKMRISKMQLYRLYEMPQLPQKYKDKAMRVGIDIDKLGQSSQMSQDFSQLDDPVVLNDSLTKHAISYILQLNKQFMQIQQEKEKFAEDIKQLKSKLDEKLDRSELQSILKNNKRE